MDKNIINELTEIQLSSVKKILYIFRKFYRIFKTS